jgi:hypothetical protein
LSERIFRFNPLRDIDGHAADPNFSVVTDERKLVHQPITIFAIFANRVFQNLLWLIGFEHLAVEGHGPGCCFRVMNGIVIMAHDRGGFTTEQLLERQVHILVFQFVILHPRDPGIVGHEGAKPFLTLDERVLHALALGDVHMGSHHARRFARVVPNDTGSVQDVAVVPACIPAAILARPGFVVAGLREFHRFQDPLPVLPVNPVLPPVGTRADVCLGVAPDFVDSFTPPNRVCLEVGVPDGISGN